MSTRIKLNSADKKGPHLLRAFLFCAIIFSHFASEIGIKEPLNISAEVQGAHEAVFAYSEPSRLALKKARNKCEPFCSVLIFSELFYANSAKYLIVRTIWLV